MPLVSTTTSQTADAKRNGLTDDDKETKHTANSGEEWAPHRPKFNAAGVTRTKTLSDEVRGVFVSCRFNSGLLWQNGHIGSDPRNIEMEDGCVPSGVIAA